METNNSGGREQCQTPKERSYCDADTHPQDPLLTQKNPEFFVSKNYRNSNLYCDILYGTAINRVVHSTSMNAARAFQSANTKITNVNGWSV